MNLYDYIAWILIISQVLFTLQLIRNYRYTFTGPKDRCKRYNFRTVLIIPCRGLDDGFRSNMLSFLRQDYPEYSLRFVVDSKTDPAYSVLADLVEKHSETSKACNIKILVADKASGNSQKIHNLLYAYKSIPENTDIIAFADSDICAEPDWLVELVTPLRRTRTAITSGYRWFIPRKNNLASIMLSVINAKITQLLGSYRYNQAWGGTMAMRVDTFRKLGIEKIWSKALSDDLSASMAAKRAKMTIVFVPKCLVASYETTNLKRLFEFGRRQFVITRIYAFRTWLTGLACMIYSLGGLWGTLAAAFCLASAGHGRNLYFAVPAVFFVCQFFRAVLRQRIASVIFRQDLRRLKIVMAADILFFWMWSIILFGVILFSAAGNTITWRGIRYRLISPEETEIISS